MESPGNVMQALTVLGAKTLECQLALDRCDYLNQLNDNLLIIQAEMSQKVEELEEALSRARKGRGLRVAVSCV